jgi:hypothetical protein
MKNLLFKKRKPENTIFFDLSGFLRFTFYQQFKRRKTLKTALKRFLGGNRRKRPVVYGATFRMQRTLLRSFFWFGSTIRTEPQ